MVIKVGCGQSGQADVVRGGRRESGQMWSGVELGFLCIFARLFQFSVCKCASYHKPLLLNLSLPWYPNLLAFLAGPILILFYPTFSLSLHSRFNLSLGLKYNNPNFFVCANSSYG